MILWMAFATLFGVLIALAGRAAEEAARTYRWPVRYVWLGALLVSAATPAVVTLTGVAWPGLLATRVSNASGMTMLLPDVVADVMRSASVSETGVPIDVPLLAERFVVLVWVLLSLIALVWFAWAVFGLARARVTWRPGLLHDRAVMLSRRAGPAVIGLRRPSIVVPEWVLAETASVQRMVLLHEEEHVRAGDHVLLALAPLLLIALPWNVPLWWQARRLRLAIELDCDARVLRRGIAAHAYGTLLLALAGQNRRSIVASAALAGPRTTLERRILAMSSRSTRYPLLRSVAAVAAMLVLGLVACETTTPMAPKAPEPGATRAEVATADQQQEVTRLESTRRDILYIVDGVVLGRAANAGTVLDRLGALNIESIDVLKGDAATARYGAAAADGAIVIVTKSREAVKVVAPSRFVEKRVDVLVPTERVKQAVTVEALPSKAVIADVIEKKTVTAHALPAKVHVVEGLPSKQNVAVDVLPTKTVVNAHVIERGVVVARPSAAGVAKTSPDNPEAEPLIVIDGREATNAELRALSRERIDSIEVLKANAARLQYGEKGRYGVILITTRGGGD